MLIDIFASAHSVSELESLISLARDAHLDGVAVVEREFSGRAREYESVSRRADFLVVQGVELETRSGRVVAFPLSIDEAFAGESWRELGERPELESVLDYFHARGGIVVARDVYDRGEGLKDRVYSAKDSRGRGFDAIDTISSRRRRIDNELSIEAQSVLGIPACAGSGTPEALGTCATLFAASVVDQKSFVAAMRGVLHWAVTLRDIGDACPMGSAPRSDDDRRDDRRRADGRRDRGERADRGDRRGDRSRGNDSRRRGPQDRRRHSRPRP